MCAFDEHKDSCNGDSGGPLTVGYEMYNRGQNDTDIKRILIGVVSYGPSKCADKKQVSYWNIQKVISQTLDWL